MKLSGWFVAILCVLLNSPVIRAEWDNPGERYAKAWEQYLDAGCPLQPDDMRHFVYFARDRDAIRDHPLLINERLRGAQVMYLWARLEPEKDVYDFSFIQQDLDYLAAHGKKLFVQLQDATFDPKVHGVPAYLLSDDFDGGAIEQINDDGLHEGWTARRWDPMVRQRFALLLNALGEQFDGKIEGINLQESAIGVDSQRDPSFSPSIYRDALKANMQALKSAFPRSTTMQYANFMPGEWLPWEDEGYLRSLYAFGEEIGVGLGAPDLMVNRKGQLNHALALMHEREYSVPLGIAVQDGNYVGLTGADFSPGTEMPVTNRDGRENQVPLLHAFARDFLKVDYMFWVNQAPYFEEDLLACLKP